MKEVTEWDGKPRWMWVWDDDYNSKIKGYVVYILSDEDVKLCDSKFPVKCGVGMGYKHCAEEKETRLTYYESSQLLKCFGVELSRDSEVCNNKMSYMKDEEIPEGYRIRYKQGEWEEPTRETVLKWREEADIERFFLFIGWDKE